jgi:hypothetical protein
MSLPHAGRGGSNRIASVGQAATHAPHELHAVGRISHGTGPAIASASVGQTATHVAEPIHRLSFTTGISRIIIDLGGRPD